MKRQYSLRLMHIEFLSVCTFVIMTHLLARLEELGVSASLGVELVADTLTEVRQIPPDGGRRSSKRRGV